MITGSRMVKNVARLICFLCPIFSNSYASNCLSKCEDEYEVCTQTLNVFEHKINVNSMKEIDLNRYLKKYNILNPTETAKIINNKIYITSHESHFSGNEKMKKKEIALFEYCLSKNQKCRKLCQR